MIPAVMVVILGGLCLIGIAYAFKQMLENLEMKRDHKQLRKEHDAMRAAIDELLIGHVNEARLKRALSRVFEDEK